MPCPPPPTSIHAVSAFLATPGEGSTQFVRSCCGGEPFGHDAVFVDGSVMNVPRGWYRTQPSVTMQLPNASRGKNTAASARLAQLQHEEASLRTVTAEQDGEEEEEEEEEEVFGAGAVS